ncbi:MAG: prephenate dehydrogenase/arogenate dehydrogenase family protein, partial [Verrucomicrobiae bacterium]|nr:prephenate dehydrogenase/arogenate dehydrogenase family protein [Verrucomicrobiae bacterium]NNJ86626.1 prephenate dehydrogenase/arogenate dehydrogenase family protein [Akkermansiaceae bacterium]
MGGALIGGIAKSDITTPQSIALFDLDTASMETLADQIGASVADSNVDLAKQSETILMAVKPQYVATVLQEIAHVLTPDHLVISVAAGVTLKTMEDSCPAGTRIIRAMPNTPAMIGLGASGIAAGQHATDADRVAARKIMASVGIAVETTESQLDAVTGLSGSGPAYV